MVFNTTFGNIAVVSNTDGGNPNTMQKKIVGLSLVTDKLYNIMLYRTSVHEVP